MVACDGRGGELTVATVHAKLPMVLAQRTKEEEVSRQSQGDGRGGERMEAVGTSQLGSAKTVVLGVFAMPA